ncbi:L-2-amino-thiazoline-4-carboxylic acid hydrolase [Candidatus Formimonas warabiya]|uniref:L-2-amino-thiazoline-4-carboxylic acid hydrolase n=1 Tax=Formimonas warabiya TaxID=1761012 RepID=A0A3G1KVK6_FORW1|nr:L-2-amino-thiazoline-4-carboxylic acid hydrolase [Candidatus Formimonas warabiya]ATW26494.1 hypothetical protein DCMF_18605 [Candidatus Formimonas warabiya]
MSNIRSTDDPGVRFAKLMAELYYFMGQEMVAQLGEEKGKEAILAAVRKFGEARVKAMKEEARDLGLEAHGTETYRRVRDMPGTGWKTNPENPLEITYCPMCEAWEQFGSAGRELGYLYCQIDHVLYGGFGVRMERPLCRAKGDGACLFLLNEKG